MKLRFGFLARAPLFLQRSCDLRVAPRVTVGCVFGPDERDLGFFQFDFRGLPPRFGISQCERLAFSLRPKLGFNIPQLAQRLCCRLEKLHRLFARLLVGARSGFGVPARTAFGFELQPQLYDRLVRSCQRFRGGQPAVALGEEVVHLAKMFPARRRIAGVVGRRHGPMDNEAIGFG